jgi:hypothetical protein
MRLRVALLAAVASLSLGAIAVPAASASNGSAAPTKIDSLPALDTVNVTGVAKNGSQFTGKFAIQRFIARRHRAYAIGTLTGMLGSRHVTRYGVMLPASLTGSTGSSSSARTAQASCSVLHLELGPVNLNLLGLQVTLGGGPSGQLPIVLDITAVPGAGNLLGNLLCDLTNALNQPGALGQLNSDLQQLTASLNGIVGLLGALGL